MSAAWRQKRGFTLLELLVAVSVFSLVAAGSYGLLETLGTTKGATDTRAQELAGIQLFHGLLRSDLMQAAVVSMAVHADEALAPVWSQDDTSLSFARSSAQGVQRVRYALDVDTEGGATPSLIREVYRAEDLKTQGTDPAAFTADRANLLGREVFSTQISELEFRYLRVDGNWTEHWSQPTVAVDTGAAGVSPPLAVEVRLQHALYGEMRALYDMPQGWPAPRNDEKESGGE